MCRNSSQQISHKKQNGFLIPMALFIIVGLGALAVSIARMGSATHSAVIREAISVQALFAAESGAQYALNQLLFQATAVNIDARCTSLNTASLNFSVSGLNGCSSALDCTVLSNTGGSAQIYQLQSEGVCGSGDLMATRIIAVKAGFGN